MFCLCCFVFQRHLAFLLTYSPTCGNSQSKTKRFYDRLSLERARHGHKKKQKASLTCLKAFENECLCKGWHILSTGYSHSCHQWDTRWDDPRKTLLCCHFFRLERAGTWQGSTAIPLYIQDAHLHGTFWLGATATPLSVKFLLYIVDLVTKLSKEEKEQETLMKTEINDAVHKWCATYPAAHQIRVAHVAFKFRCRISSTICFLVAAYRLLAKAPWTTNMIAVDIKQAAFYAISKGWSLKDPTAGDFPFSVAELAVAAATYLEQIPPGVPEAPFYALFVMLGFLPPVCSKLFSTVTLTCAHCLATCTAPCPFFNTHVTWTMTEWVDLATALAEATMHPWVQSQGWHAEGCNMSQHLIDLKNMTSWVLLQLQPEHHDKYPFVCDSMNLAKDQSLLRINATITAFLCSNSRGQQDRHRHYWVVEFENGLPKYVFDSLQGKQRLTTELAKKLRVFGVLFNVGNEHVPFLRTRYLDEAAGIVPAIHRGRNPIIVLGRGRIQWARNALCKKYKTPTPKKGRVQKQASLKLQVLHLYQDIVQMILSRFLRSQMTLNLKITLKLNLVNCGMIFRCRLFLNVVTTRRKTPHWPHRKLVLLLIPKKQLPLLNGKLVPLAISRVLALLHGKLVPLLILVRLLV